RPTPGMVRPAHQSVTLIPAQRGPEPLWRAIWLGSCGFSPGSVADKPKYVNMADLTAMADLKSAGSDRPAREGEPIWDIIELLFFAYRDFVSEPDDVLAKFGFGRAHHRVLHFVNRNPGMKVAELLDILKITKQSLGRVLKQLVDQGYVVQKEGA